MNKWFTAKTIEGLRKRYKKLIKRHHPDNGGSVGDMQSIHAEYDRLFSILSVSNRSGKECSIEGEKDAYKAILERLAEVDVDIEICGCWLWVHDGYMHRELLKSLGFRFSRRKRAWYWHADKNYRYHSMEATMDEIRSKYGSQKVNGRNGKRWLAQ